MCVGEGVCRDLFVVFIRNLIHCLYSYVRGSVLDGADLGHCELQGANLESAKLRKCTFTDAIMSADTKLSGAKFSSFVPTRRKSGARQGPRGAMQASFLVSMAKSSFAEDSEDDVDVESEGEGNEGEKTAFEEMAEASMSGIIEKMVDASYRVAIITDEASKVLKSFIDGERKKSDEIIREKLERLKQDRSTPSPSLRIKLPAEIHERFIVIL